MSLTLNIDRQSDPEVVIVKCYLDDEPLNEIFSFDPEATDEQIQSIVSDYLLQKGYNLE